jgi:[CysO sulfur-carrier protein]-S-L-cysteine hydrolase
MRIAQDQLDEMIAHARRDLPNECCGLVGVRDGRVTHVVPVENTAASPFRFEMGFDQFRAIEAIEEAGAEVGAMYHSHPRTEAYPSLTDMSLSDRWPGLRWIIVGHVDSEPSVRSFTVTRQDVEEVALEVE